MTATDSGVPDAAVIAAPQPPTAHESPAADPGSNAPGAAPVGTGRLKIVILPWAEAWLDGKPPGQTPIVGLEVAAGMHRIRLKNDNKEKTVTVTVTTSKLAVIDETWSGYGLHETASSDGRGSRAELPGDSCC